jgi:hypothetical protein
MDDINEALYMLYLSATADKFKGNLQEYIDYLTKTWPPYAKYFFNQWVKTVPPIDWAT